MGTALVSQLLKSPASDTCRVVGAAKANRVILLVNFLLCVEVVCILLRSLLTGVFGNRRACPPTVPAATVISKG